MLPAYLREEERLRLDSELEPERDPREERLREDFEESEDERPAASISADSISLFELELTIRILLI